MESKVIEITSVAENGNFYISAGGFNHITKGFRL